MKPEDIASSYDQIANIWNSSNFPRENGIKQHERAIAFVKNRNRALDIGCGSSGRIIDLLQSHGFLVEGVDISVQMLELAKKRHPDVTFHHADICHWVFPEKYDLISAWDSIWHLPLFEQKPVMQKIMQALNPGGVFIFTTAGLDEPTEKTDSAMGPKIYYRVPGIPQTLSIISASACICRHLEYDQYPEQHLYIIAQKK
ncbi:MAG: class I SAM-dependent methyltransferase [Candidatus Riflebacteria bacterium]